MLFWSSGGTSVHEFNLFHDFGEDGCNPVHVGKMAWACLSPDVEFTHGSKILPNACLLTKLFTNRSIRVPRFYCILLFANEQRKIPISITFSVYLLSWCTQWGITMVSVCRGAELTWAMLLRTWLRCWDPRTNVITGQ